MRSARLFLLWVVMSWAVIWTGFAITDLYLQQASSQQISQRIQLEKRITKHQRAVEGFNAQTESKTKTLKRAAELQNLLSKSSSGYQLLLMLAHTIPDRARYIEVDFSNGGLTVIGIADSNQVVAQLMKSVEISSLKLSVQLLSTEMGGEKTSSVDAPSTHSNEPQSVRFRVHANAPSGEGVSWRITGAKVKSSRAHFSSKKLLSLYTQRKNDVVKDVISTGLEVPS